MAIVLGFADCMGVITKKEIIYLALSLIFFVILQIWSIFSESRTFDEALHVDAGYAFLASRDFAKEPFNPPFARELLAIPTLINSQTLRDPIFFQQRLVVVLISCVLLAGVFFVSRKLFGTVSALFSSFLFIFEPEILAHGHYAATDMILACFIFFSIICFILWRREFTYKRLLILGILIGLTLSIKISAIPFLLFSFVLLYVFDNKRDGFMTSSIVFRPLLVVICISLFTIWTTYFFTWDRPLGDGFVPKNEFVKKIMYIPGMSYLLTQPLPLGGYLRTIKQDLLYNYSSDYVKPAFLMGKFSQHGFWYFYPIAFILKTPFPLLILLLLVLIHDKKRKYIFLLLPVLAIFISASLSTLNLGVRYILPIYPFLILYASQVVFLKFPHKKLFLFILLVWYSIGTLLSAPHFLSYMSGFTGNKKYTFLIDSNYDWGQGLLSLRKYQEIYHIDKLQLAYFGMVDPMLYGLRYERINDISLGDKKAVHSFRTQKGTAIAISASCYYYCGYYKYAVFAQKKPQIIGGSILLFTF